MRRCRNEPTSLGPSAPAAATSSRAMPDDVPAFTDDKKKPLNAGVKYVRAIRSFNPG